MNFERILRHAINVVVRYRALWVLGFIWAIVGGAGGGANGIQYTFGGGSSSEGTQLGGDVAGVDPGAVVALIIPLLIGACCLILLLILITTVVRYVVMVGVMRSLDQLDRFEIEPTVRGAWSEGWNGRTWRPFLQNLIVGIPMAILIMLTLIPVMLPLLLGVFGDEGPLMVGIAAMCGLFCLWLAAVIVVATVISVLQQLWWRAAVLDDLDFISAMVAGWRLARANVGPLVAAWIVMFVVGVIWFAMSVVIGMALGLFTVAAAGIPAFLLHQVTGTVVLPILAGAAIAMLTFGLPMAFAQGLYLVFHASVWNQIYRQLPNRDVAGLDWAEGA